MREIPPQVILAIIVDTASEDFHMVEDLVGLAATVEALGLIHFSADSSIPSVSVSA